MHLELANKADNVRFNDLAKHVDKAVLTTYDYDTIKQKVNQGLVNQEDFAEATEDLDNRLKSLTLKSARKTDLESIEKAAYSTELKT